MKNRIPFAIVLILFLTAGVSIVKKRAKTQPTVPGSSTPAVITLALTPTQDPDQLLISASPLVDFLKKELDIQVKIKTVTDYFSMVTALEGGHADVAFMPGLPMIMAMKRADCRPICIQIQRGKTSYFSHIYVRKDSGINTLADLKNRRIAFTDPVSSSGFLYPSSLFFDKGLLRTGETLDKFFSKVYWAGGYESAILAMYNGHVDASCGSQYAPDWYLDTSQRNEIRLLARAGPLPTHGIVVRKALGNKFVDDLQSSFLKLNETANRHILKDLYYSDGLEAADESTYDSVREKAFQSGLFKEFLKIDVENP